MEEPEIAEFTLGDYLSELCALLQMDGFSISIQNLVWKPVHVQICTDYMGRIMDNLVSIQECLGILAARCASCNA